MDLKQEILDGQNYIDCIEMSQQRIESTQDLFVAGSIRCEGVPWCFLV